MAQATQMLAMLRTQPAGPYAALQQLAQVGSGKPRLFLTHFMS